MTNPLFNLLGGGNQQMLGKFGNMANMIQQFNQFRNGFNGNPQQIVNDMLKNGQISQQQFDQVAQMATQFQKMLGK